MFLLLLVLYSPFLPPSGLFVCKMYIVESMMVNVILVDFRGLDTMLEALVLGIAALGIVVLIKLRMTGREDV